MMLEFLRMLSQSQNITFHILLKVNIIWSIVVIQHQLGTWVHIDVNDIIFPSLGRAAGFNNHDEMFNYFHSSLRCTIERTFVVWKNRFAILRHMPNFKYTTQVKIVVTTMTIHNFIRRNSVSDIEFQHEDEDDITMEDLDSNHNLPTRTDADIVSSEEMSYIRDLIRNDIVAAQVGN